MAMGIVILAVGGIIWLAGRFLGNQSFPGTLHIDFQGGSCVIPILACIVISVVLTVVLNVVARWLGR